MSDSEEYGDIVDRVKYKEQHGKWPPDGPWANEPDFKEWQDQHGLECQIFRNDTSGAWCGYVMLPKGHPLHGVHYDSVPAQYEIDIHGGLTYSDWASHLLSCLDDDDRWAFGFDCGHCYDSTPLSPMKQFKDCQYRDMAYVLEETENLAQQLYYIGRMESVKLTMPPNCE